MPLNTFYVRGDVDHTVVELTISGSYAVDYPKFEMDFTWCKKNNLYYDIVFNLPLWGLQALQLCKLPMLQFVLEWLQTTYSDNRTRRVNVGDSEILCQVTVKEFIEHLESSGFRRLDKNENF